MQGLIDALAELVAGQAAVDEVALKLGDDRLAIGVTHPQIGTWPEAARRVHTLTIYRAYRPGCQEIRATTSAQPPRRACEAGG